MSADAAPPVEFAPSYVARPVRGAGEPPPGATIGSNPLPPQLRPVSTTARGSGANQLQAPAAGSRQPDSLAAATSALRPLGLAFTVGHEFAWSQPARADEGGLLRRMQDIEVGLHAQMASLSAEMAALRAVVDASIAGVAIGSQPSIGLEYPAVLPSHPTDVLGDDWCELLEHAADHFEVPGQETFRVAEVALYSPDPAVRVAAGRVLARGGEDNRAQVKAALESEASAYVRRALGSALEAV